MDYDSWTYSRILTDGNATAETDFTMRVALTALNFDFTHAQSDGSDVRFWDHTGDAAIPYWIESWNAAGQTAVIWIKADSASDNRMYYGKTGVSSASNLANTFAFADDMETAFGWDDCHLSVPESANTTIPTYDGAGQTVHPSVVDMQVHGLSTWNGYRFWLCDTPYPNSDDSKENPSIFCSSDGLTWVVPAGLTNPVEAKPATGINSDPELVYNPEDGKLWMYFRQSTSASDNSIFVRTSSDGVTWTAKAEVLAFTGVGDVSPTVIHKATGEWIMFALDGTTHALHKYTSSDGLTWSAASTCTVNGAGGNQWHMSARWVPAYNKFWGIWSSANSGGALQFLTSSDGDTWTLGTVNMIEDQSSGWSAAGAYRPTFQVNTTSGNLELWYSARDTASSPIVWRVGYTEKSHATINAAFASFYGGWTKTGGDNATWNRSTAQVARAAHAGKTTGALTQLEKSTGSVNTGYFEADFYDNGTATAGTLAALRLYNGSQRITLGVYTTSSTTKYSYGNKANTYTATSVDRATGWHKLGIRLLSDQSVVFYIDDAQVGTLASQFASVSHVQIASASTWGTGYFDDVRVRGYAATEPALTLGSEFSSPTLTATPSTDRMTLTSDTPDGATDIVVEMSDDNAAWEVVEGVVISGPISYDVQNGPGAPFTMTAGVTFYFRLKYLADEVVLGYSTTASGALTAGGEETIGGLSGVRRHNPALFRGRR